MKVYLMNSGLGLQKLTREEIQKEYIDFCESMLETAIRKKDEQDVNTFKQDIELLTTDFDNYVLRFAQDIGDELKIYELQGE